MDTQALPLAPRPSRARSERCETRDSGDSGDSRARPGLVVLAPGTARRLPAVRRARWLAVVEGQLWLTATASRRQASADLWLAAGDGHRIEAGVEVVVEGWPQAGFQLIEAVEPARAGAVLRWAAAGLRAGLALRPLHTASQEQRA